LLVVIGELVTGTFFRHACRAELLDERISGLFEFLGKFGNGRSRHV